MSAPLESQAIALLEKRPLLRRLLLIVAVIGIAKGAYDTLSGAVEPLIAPIKRLLPISPTDVEAERFYCAVRIPRLIWSVNTFTQDRLNAKIAPNALARQTLIIFNRDISTCHRLLGFSNTPLKEVSNVPEQLAQALSSAFDEILQNHAAFKGFIANADRPVAKVLALSEQIELLHNSLTDSCTPGKGNCVDALREHELQMVKDIEFAQRQVEETFPYKLVPPRLNTGDRFQLRDSVLCYRIELDNIVGPAKPEKIEVKEAAVQDGLGLSVQQIKIPIPLLKCPSR
ncbi:MAG: hypothetical protein LCI02_20770 [Proteobacteria bacterium]|nr:hypothetical protein [Pseudomonadota bacterium]